MTALIHQAKSDAASYLFFAVVIACTFLV